MFLADHGQNRELEETNNGMLSNDIEVPAQATHSVQPAESPIEASTTPSSPAHSARYISRLPICCIVCFRKLIFCLI